MTTCTLKGLAFCLNFAYIKDTIAKSIVRFDDLLNKRRTNAIISIVGVFLYLPFNGSCARDTVRCAGFLLCQFVNLRIATALNYLTMISGSFFKLTKGTIAMSITTLSKQFKTTAPKQGSAKKHPFIRQFFYKRRIKRAIHALHSNKPLLDRLCAYNKNSINA